MINRYREILTTAQLDALKSKTGGVGSSGDVQHEVHLNFTYIYVFLVHHLSKEYLFYAFIYSQNTSGSVDNQSRVSPTPCSECQKYRDDADKLRNDLLKAAKLRNEMEADWSRISHDFQVIKYWVVIFVFILQLNFVF